jgi:DNA invertase Pin-like site-specific DNA recombinase
MDTIDTPKPPVRAGCYLRISSDPDDKRGGVDRQREDTADICAMNDWKVAGYYEDNDRSASNGKAREEWERLLADVKAAKIDAIVVWNQDRGWRKMADLESLRPLLEPRGVLLATTNIGVIDVRNADDVFRAQVSTATSELEIAKMRIRQRRFARQRAERGIPKWKHAFGYVVGEHRPDCPPKCSSYHHQRDAVTAPLVEKAYKAILAGNKLGDVCRLFNDAGAYGLNGQPWTASTVSLFLRAPRNAALRSHNGEIVGAGNWPRLVEESLWKAAQAKLNAPDRKRPGKKSVQRHLLTGVLLCGKPGCGGHLAGNWVMQAHGKGPRAHAITYACRTCRGTSVRAEHVEPLLYDLVGGRLAMDDARDLLKAEIHDEAEAEALRTELNELHAEVKQIGIDRGRRLLTSEQAKIATDVILEDIAKLERKQEDQDRLRVFEGLDLGTPRVIGQIRKLSADRFRAVLAVLCTVTVAPVGKGHRVNGERFDPERVHVLWRQPNGR